MSEISVVVPAFNADRFLNQCLASILNQSLMPREVIVVDDASLDSTRDIVSAFKGVRYLRTDHLANGQVQRGCATARNLGITIATSEYIAFIDADDTWEPNKLEVQFESLMREPGFPYSYTLAINVLDDEIKSKPTWTPQHSYEKPGFVALIPSTLVAKSKVFEDGTLMFNETYYVGSDMDWYLRMKEACGSPLIVNEILTRRRIHKDNLGHLSELNSKTRLQILRSSAQRKERLDG